MTDQALSQVYLFVSPEGEILGDKRTNLHNASEIETWYCEYFESFFRVAMIHPKETEAQVIKIPNEVREGLRQKVKQHTNRKVLDAKHEAGHVILIYALRVATVEEMDIRPTAMPDGNLHYQLRTHVASSARFIGARTFTLISEADQQARSVRQGLGMACSGFGGWLGSGDQIGAGGDLDKIRKTIAALLGSARQGVWASQFAPSPTVPNLENRLKSLAQEILSNPEVKHRQEELAKQLATSETLTQQEIEAIIDPGTLPDYSDRLELIRKDFNLNDKY